MVSAPTAVKRDHGGSHGFSVAQIGQHDHRSERVAEMDYKNFDAYRKAAHEAGTRPTSLRIGETNNLREKYVSAAALLNY